MTRTIAIDGPGASGKNTVGMFLAQRLGYPFIDSGVMYRAATLQAMAEGIDPNDREALWALAQRLRFHFVPPSAWHPAGRILVDGQDITDVVHTPAVDASVSLVARIPEVREVLVQQQRRLAEQGPVVMAGRDIGTVVLPQAELKIYLDAPLEERAARRYRELRGRGEDVEYRQVLTDLERRDRLDQERAVSPLRPATDAVIVNTDGLAPAQVVDLIIDRFVGCREQVPLRPQE